MEVPEILSISITPKISIERWKTHSNSLPITRKIIKSSNLVKYLPYFQQEFNFLSSQEHIKYFCNVFEPHTSEKTYEYSSQYFENLLKSQLNYFRFCESDVLNLFLFAFEVYTRGENFVDIHHFEPSMIACSDEGFVLVNLMSKYEKSDEKYLPGQGLRGKLEKFQVCFYSVGLIALEMLGVDICGLNLNFSCFLVNREVELLGVSMKVKNLLQEVLVKFQVRSVEDLRRMVE